MVKKSGKKRGGGKKKRKKTYSKSKKLSFFIFNNLGILFFWGGGRFRASSLHLFSKLRIALNRHKSLNVSTNSQLFFFLFALGRHIYFYGST